jgi:Bacterial Ig domain/Secretion system C-terminal sorting domain
LKLYKSGGGNSLDVDVYRATSFWKENEASWNNRITGTEWTTRGGDFDPSLLATNFITADGIYDWNITSTVSNWYTNPSSYPNNGVLLKTTEGGGDRAPNFVSTENTSGLMKPTLEISYTIPLLCKLIPVRPPLSMPDTAQTNALTPISIPVLNNDYFPNAGSNTISIIPGSVSSGSAITSGSNIEYTPISSFSGTATLQYRVVNTVTGLADTALVYIFITYAPPIAYNDSATIYSGGNVSVNVTTNDIDPQNIGLTAIVIAGPKFGTLIQTGNIISYTAPFNFYGRDTITYRLTNAVTSICNEANAADTAYLIIIVLNRPPVAINDTATTNPCQSLIIDVLDNDSDPENGSLSVASVSAVTPLAAGTATTDGYRIFFTPNSNFAGASASFTYTIADDAVPPAISNPATIIINFSSSQPNRPPIAVNDSVVGLYNNPTFINALNNDSDPDNDLFTISIGSGLLMPANGTITLLGNGLIQYTPNNNFFGTDVFEYKITDSHFAPGAGACSPTSLESIARVYILITNFYIVLDKNDIILSGTANGNHNLLYWTVQQNNLTANYVIEKSTDNIRFAPIGSLQHDNNADSTYAYQFADQQLHSAIAYYRIRRIRSGQPDILSNTILIKNKSNGIALKVFPVPFSSAFNVSFFATEEKNMSVALYNSNGSIISQKNIVPKKGMNQVSFENLQHLPDAVYFISLTQNNQTISQKILKITAR